MPEEQDAVVIPPVQGDPREGARVPLGPLREQRRLAVPGGRDHGRKGSRDAQPFDHVLLGHGAGSDRRRAELRLNEVERNVRYRHRNQKLAQTLWAYAGAAPCQRRFMPSGFYGQNGQSVMSPNRVRPPCRQAIALSARSRIRTTPPAPADRTPPETWPGQ